MKAATSTAEKAALYLMKSFKQMSLDTVRGTRSALDGAVTTLRVGQGGLQLGNAIVQKAVLDLQGDLAMIKARADAEAVGLEDIIKSLQALINRLMELLSQTVSLVGECGRLAPKITQDAAISFDGIVQRG